MPEFGGAGFHIVGHKCFRGEPQGFDQVERVNLIVGRNNTGKSALIGLMNSVCAGGSQSAPDVEVSATVPVTLDRVHALRQDRTLASAARLLADGEVRFSLRGSDAGKPLQYRLKDTEWTQFGESVQLPLLRAAEAIVKEVGNPAADAADPQPKRRRERTFAGIAAERQVVAEPLSLYAQHPLVDEHGVGCTSALANVITADKYASEIVEVELLEALNAIVQPDSHFERITVQRVGEAEGQDTWEVFFDEKRKGRIALSSSGSGFQTVILVLVKMILLPKVEQRALARFMFAFEEIENNLHPSLQRRLFEYIYETALREGCVVFLTSHSTVLMDAVATRRDTAVFHVTHNGEVAEVRSVGNLSEGREVLDDLGVKASDILQANGVVWVEGVTDRMYVEYWMKRWCNENHVRVPRLGSEYVFAQYGGSCLSHYDYCRLSEEGFKDSTIGEAIDAFRLSRNAFVIMDSDRKKSGQRLSRPKLDARSAVGESNCWVTWGKEVENYLPEVAMRSAIGVELKQYDALTKAKPNVKKLAVARRAIEAMDDDGAWQQAGSDLKTRIAHLVKVIQSWNS